jgi:transketolase
MNQFGGTHFGGSLSCVEILKVLYDTILTKDDIFILSKGHACWPYYVLLNEKGLHPKIESHPHADSYNGIHCSTGSLGHGLPFGLGIALSKKIKKEKGTVYVLMGDGECQEGTLWESLLIAASKKINNIVVIVDNNSFQGCGSTSELFKTSKLHDIAIICGWDTITIDGHNDDEIINSMQCFNNPKIVIANTIKGKGISFMENKPEWHSKPLFGELENNAKKELQ